METQVAPKRALGLLLDEHGSLSSASLAERTQRPKAEVTRDLEALQSADLAILLTSGQWQLTSAGRRLVRY